jgi:hypothetical protein
MSIVQLRSTLFSTVAYTSTALTHNSIKCYYSMLHYLLMNILLPQKACTTLFSTAAYKQYCYLYTAMHSLQQMARHWQEALLRHTCWRSHVYCHKGRESATFMCCMSYWLVQAVSSRVD